MNEKSKGGVKTKILLSAQSLFYTKGYEKTSVENIISEAGVSKGGFYHYFKSKEKLLDELLNMHIEKHVLSWREVIKRHDLNAFEKLKIVFENSAVIKSADPELIITLCMIYKSPENLLLRYKQQKISVELMNREFLPLIYQGIDEGIFRIAFPENVFKILITISSTYFDEICNLLLEFVSSGDISAKDNIKTIYNEINYYFCNVLGMEKEKDVFDGEMIDKFFKNFGKKV